MNPDQYERQALLLAYRPTYQDQFIKRAACLDTDKKLHVCTCIKNLISTQEPFGVICQSVLQFYARWTFFCLFVCLITKFNS